MKSAAAVVLAATLAAAQDRMAETLRKGVLEEESNQNLGAAIRAYESVVTQFDEARKTAATALFRLAETYRKQGNKDKAVAAYRRVVREFADQTTLVEQSRNHLAKTFNFPVEAAGDQREPPEVIEARKRFRAILEEELKLAEEQVQVMERNYRQGAPVMDRLAAAKQRVLEARRAIAGFDLGIIPRQ